MPLQQQNSRSLLFLLFVTFALITISSCSKSADQKNTPEQGDTKYYLNVIDTSSYFKYVGSDTGGVDATSSGVKYFTGLQSLINILPEYFVFNHTHNLVGYRNGKAVESYDVLLINDSLFAYNELAEQRHVGTFEKNKKLTINYYCFVTLKILMEFRTQSYISEVMRLGKIDYSDMFGKHTANAYFNNVKEMKHPSDMVTWLNIGATYDIK